jgi:enoyl-CoA hydratase/carnithine racemase
MELKTLRVESEGAIATVWLNRPHRLNAWTGRMHTEFRWLLDQLNTDDTTRVVIITGQGRGFCAGADSKALEGHVERGSYDPGTPADVANPGYGVQPEFDADFAWMLALDVVTLGAINGPAAGVGFVLACYCDLRFAAEGTKLTTSHGKLNLPAEYGLSWLLPRLIGLTHANDLLLSSRVVRAEEAAAMGLINRVVPAEDVLTDAMDYANQLVRLVSPASLATTKRQIAVDQLHDNVGSSVRRAQQLLDEMASQPDYMEAIRVFGTDENPNWSQPPRSMDLAD